MMLLVVLGNSSQPDLARRADFAIVDYVCYIRWQESWSDSISDTCTTSTSVIYITFTLVFILIVLNNDTHGAQNVTVTSVQVLINSVSAI